MYIHEAIAKTSKTVPYITRKAWTIDDESRAVIKVLSTDTPDCCVLVSAYSTRGPVRGWQPRKEDLIANDWYPCGGVLCLNRQTE